MQNKIIAIALIMISTSILLAKENQSESKRDRIHSPRKAIDSMLKVEQKEVSATDSFKNMFKNAKASGQIRMEYASYNQEKKNTYATAIGGILKYELAQYRGFNAAIAVYTSNDINYLTGDTTKHNNELSSTSGSYTEMAEAYINYQYDNLNLRAGRQLLDTPLADSDDIRMIQNTFEAYTLTYSFNNFEFIAGNIQRWQGVDAGLDAGWSITGKNGTNFGGISYEDTLEFDAWFYNITDQTNAAYIDAGVEYELNSNFTIHTMIQYLNENSINNSDIEASIYGGMLELVAYNIGFNIAYNKANVNDTKKSFSGTGGGTLFTSMDTMILDNIAINMDAKSLVTGISYEFNSINFIYAYGDFKSDIQHITEQDIGAEYTMNNEFVIAAIFVMQEDKRNSAKTDYDWNRFQLMLNYNF